MYNILMNKKKIMGSTSSNWGTMCSRLMNKERLESERGWPPPWTDTMMNSSIGFGPARDVSSPPPKTSN